MDHASNLLFQLENMMNDLQMARVNLRNFIVFLNQKIIKFFKVDPNQSQSELENLENHKSQLNKMQVDVKMLQEYLE